MTVVVVSLMLQMTATNALDLKGDKIPLILTYNFVSFDRELLCMHIIMHSSVRMTGLG